MFPSVSLPKLEPLPRLSSINQHFRLRFIDTGGGGDTGSQDPTQGGTDQGGGGGGGGWPTGGMDTGNCFPGDPTCGPGGPFQTTPVIYTGGGGGSPAPTTTSSSSSSCSLLNPFSWSVGGCLERAVILILGIIAIIGGIYLLKPSVITEPVRAVKRAAEVGATAAAAG